MTRALLRKELREMWPWAALSVCIGALDIVPMLLSQLDMQPFGHTVGTFTDPGFVVCWIMALAIGTGLTTREQDDGTLGFLDGLPVTRSRVFLVKCGVTVAVVMLAPLVRFAIVLIEHLLSRGSLDYALHPTILLQFLALQLLLISGAVLLGAAVGRLRSLTWLTLGVLASGLMLAIRNFPRASLLNPLALLETQLTSTGLAFDMETVWTQLGISALALAAAWYGFSRAGKPRRALVSTRPVIGALVTMGGIAAIVTAGALWMETEPNGNGTPQAGAVPTPRFAPSPPAQSTTTYYRISYPAHRSQQALALAQQADAIFERVHALLGVAPGPRIVVDASGSSANTVGTAFFGRIRLQLDDGAAATLAHETAHVVARRIAGNVAADKWQSATVLDEGLATWIQQQLVAPQDPQAQLLVLGALHTRRELKVAELFDPVLLAAMRDENIKYPAGAALITATVRLYGQDALQRLLRAFADPRLPDDLRNEALWQAGFQLAGMDLALVFDEFYRTVAAYAKQHAGQIAALPRPRVRLVKTQQAIGVQPLIDAAPSAAATPNLRLRFKPAPDSGTHELDDQGANVGVPIWRARSQISGGRICVQPGILAASQVLYEPWVCLPVSDAVEWKTGVGSQE